MNDVMVAPGSNLPTADTAVSMAVNLTPPQKAAIVLSIIPPADAAEMLKTFPEATLLNFAKAVSELGPVQPETLSLVVIEFLTAMGEETDIRGGVNQVRKFLEQFMDDEDVDLIIKEIVGQSQRPLWERFSEAPTEMTSHYLALEHPQTIAFIMTKLRSDRAAAIMEKLDRELAQSVVLRMARPPSIEAGAIKQMEAAIETDFLSAIGRQSGAIKPAELIANLMNNVSSASREEFIQNLEETDPVLAQDVIRTMFTFADIVARVPGMDIAKVVKEVEEERLLIALRFAKDTENPTYDFVMANLSKRLSERLAEDIDAMEAVKDSEGEAAQMEVVNLIQAKAKMGEIKLNEPEPE